MLAARHRRLGRTVALKELLPGRETAVARFLREALVTRLWQLDTGQSRVVPHESNLKLVRFSRDGRHIFSGGHELRRWDDDLPWDAPGLRAWIDAHTDEVAPSLLGPADQD